LSTAETKLKVAIVAAAVGAIMKHCRRRRERNRQRLASDRRRLEP
jgi:hypothetical protein